MHYIFQAAKLFICISLHTYTHTFIDIDVQLNRRAQNVYSMPNNRMQMVNIQTGMYVCMSVCKQIF